MADAHNKALMSRSTTLYSVQEVCADGDFDGREENTAFFGLETIARGSIEVPASVMTEDQSGGSADIM
ncbi:hypothetical protein CPB85DRAFT_1436696 [Mucidula mucida]|nr:hypothetical protein CPB85DRAFT_1436696 [Mucidula mucida]